MDKHPPAALSDTLHEAAVATLAVVKPRLRGWLHAGAFPCAVVAGIVLVILADGERARTACLIYSSTAALLFGVSAVYHRGTWSPRAHDILKRLDHASIFLIIAGTYTPFAVLVLPPGPREAVLWVVWLGAAAGVVFRVLWVGAPRWLYVPLYIGLGWTAIFVVPEFLEAGGVMMTVLVIVGGALYSLGGVVYAFQRPDPLPRIFGFHEVFHALTIAAFAVQYVAVSLAAY